LPVKSGQHAYPLHDLRIHIHDVRRFDSDSILLSSGFFNHCLDGSTGELRSLGARDACRNNQAVYFPCKALKKILRCLPYRTTGGQFLLVSIRYMTNTAIFPVAASRVVPHASSCTRFLLKPTPLFEEAPLPLDRSKASEKQHIQEMDRRDILLSG